MDKETTIASISTPIGTGGISIIRMSGPNSLNIAKKVFVSKKELKPRVLTLGTFKSKDFEEKCLCVYFKEPYSFTGEDMIEFQCHGGVALTQGILTTLLDNGANLAENGEFSKRAFLNGKINLTQAEGMIDMINAESTAEIKAGYNLLKGELGKKIQLFQDELTDLIAEIEVSFDYPENDYELNTKENAKKIINNVILGLEKLINSGRQGKILKDGVNVLIIGEPNVGKSSLLNSLILEDKAIVSNRAGTTRDIVEAKYLYNGIKFNLFDTAGLRETEDEVENIGINKAKSLINESDIILRVIDTSKKNTNKYIENLLQGKKYYIVKNKVDLGDKNKEIPGFCISAKNSKGIEELKKHIYDIVFKEKIKENNLVITNARHLELLKKSKNYLQNALKNIDLVTLDITSIDINQAWQTLGEITGETSSEEILNSIFSKFCLGK